jgi:tRNA(Ile)-lysidine synthase TilS/MesJ
MEIMEWMLETYLAPFFREEKEFKLIKALISYINNFLSEIVKPLLFFLKKRKEAISVNHSFFLKKGF